MKVFKLILKVLLIKKEPPANQASTWFINKRPGSCKSKQKAAACPGPALAEVWVGGFGHPPRPCSAPTWLSWDTGTTAGAGRGGLGLLAAQRLCWREIASHKCGEAKQAHRPRTKRWAKLLAPLSRSFPLVHASTPAPQHPLEPPSHPSSRKASKEPPGLSE